MLKTLSSVLSLGLVFGIAIVTVFAGLFTQHLPGQPNTQPIGNVSGGPTMDTETNGETSIPEPDYSFLNDFPGNNRIYGVMTAAGSTEELDTFEGVVKKAPNLVGVNVDWTTAYDSWHTERLAERGAMPMISWEPWEASKVSTVEQLRSEQPDYSVDEILSGRYDHYIDDWATALADWGHPVMLRFAHEMNGHWYPWADGRNGNTNGSYVELWRYVHDRFDAAGVKNVRWVWSPNVSYHGSTPLAALYPGDDYVDWVGVVGYFGHMQSEPVSQPGFNGIFASTLDELAEVTDKPIIITETGAGAYGAMKAQWIQDLVRTGAEHPKVHGFVWFHVNKEQDWRVNSSPAALKAFAEAVADPVYNQPT